MELWSNDFSDGDPIPGSFAFCLPDPASHTRLGPNRNPHLAWSGPPEGTLSYALIVHDRDAPTKPDDVNQEGREVPSDLPRADFYHWVLVDLPAGMTRIEAGSASDGVVPRGKTSAAALGGARHGLNDYTGWFAGDEHMAGDYHGYDGPCPPWNDSLVHHYVFTLSALDVVRLDLPDGFNGSEARAAIRDRVLATAVITGTYTLNPRLS